MAVEARVMFYSKEIVRCVKDPQVISHLEADAIIIPDVCSKLKKMHRDGDSFEANEIMIDNLLKSNDRGKWKSFLTALEKSEYGYIKYLLETEGKPGVKDEREKTIIRVFTPYLEKNIDVMDITTELYARNVINDNDSELIRAICNNMGNINATTVLLERMQCRLAPGEWYYQFLDVLRLKNFEHIVKEIEPDFLKCPEQYRQREAIECEGTKPNTELYCAEEQECATSGDVQEHVLMDCGEADEHMDESVPEPLDDHLEVDFTMKETCDLSLGNDNTCKRSTTQDTMLYTRHSDDNNIPKMLETAKLGKRTPPEGQDITCEEVFSADKTQAVDKHIENSSVCMDIKSHPGSDEIAENYSEDILLTKSDTDRGMVPIAERLYPFQHELAENALAGKNTIICAPTGSGKTWVATHIIDRHLKSTSTGGKDRRRVAFMARNSVLVKQQMEFISNELTSAHVKHIEGNTEESLMINAFIDDYDIFLFTPQILVNNLNSDIKSVSVFSLLILDECHHTKGNEPYNVLMKYYHMEKKKGVKGLPQIVGLTASIGTGRAKSEDDALDHIFRVCSSLDVRCLSTVEKNKEDLAKHFSVPREEKIVMKKRHEDPCRSILLEAVKNTADKLGELALMEPKLIQIMHKCPKDLEGKSYEIWIATVINVAESLVGGQSRDITTCAKYLQIYYNALEINRLLRKVDIAMYLAKQHKLEVDNPENLTKNESFLLENLIDVQKELQKVETENPNVHAISEIIRGLFSDENADVESRVMVFVHARATCRALAEFLNDELEEIHVKASPLIGKETRGTDKGMTEDEQTQVLNEFKEGTYKVLVATSIGMEGLDVPDCNMTLNYNFSGNEITKIQMSGRSRKENGKEVQIQTEAQFAKDSIVMYRIKLMNEAIARFQEMDNSSINRKVLALQKKIVEDFKWEQKCKQMKRSKQSAENDYEIHCRRCGTFVCNTSNLRQLDTSYLVAEQNFYEKINKKPHTKRGNMGALQKKFKMICKHCPKDLGVIAVKDQVEFFVLKLDSLKFISINDRKEATTYKKWCDMPYKVKVITIRDLDAIYQNN